MNAIETASGNGRVPEITNPELAVDVILKNEAVRRAGADPLPGPLADAFIDPEIKVAGITVLPIVASNWVALKAVDSPMIGAIADVVQSGKMDTEIGDEQAWEICWIFTHTPKEFRAAFKGKEEFRELVREQIGDASPAYPWNLVWTACLAQIKRHMETVVKQTAEATEDGALRFFLDSQAKAQSPADGS